MASQPELESTPNRVVTASTQVEVEMNQLRQQVATLEQENRALWADLKVCQNSPSSQAQVAELEKAYAVLQTEVRERYRCEQVLQGEAALAREQEQAAQERAAKLARANESLIRRSLDQLPTDRNLDAFLGHILREAIQMLDGASAQIFLYDLESERLISSIGVNQQGEIVAAPGLVKELPLGQPFPANTTNAWQRLLHQRGPINFHLDRDADDFWPGMMEWHRRMGHLGSICTAMVMGEQPLGVLGLACRERTEFTASEFEFVQALGQQAALAIQLTQLAEEAKQAAILGERNRMAREIHDSLAQVFTSVLVRLQTAQLALQDNPTEAQTYLDQTSDLARQGLSEARRSVHALRPQVLEGGNLAGALSHCLHQITHGTSVHASFHQTGQSYRLPEQLQLELFRIGQEAITNACKHAHPTTIEVELSFLSQQIQLAIQDNGQGFILADPPQSQGFGLIGMHERTQIIGGKLTISSQPQQGTQVLVTVEVATPNRRYL